MDDEEKQRKPLLRVVSVEFVPSPDAERRLARVYDLLLGKDIRKSHRGEAGQDTDTASEDRP
ncbi:hypothetical protein M1O12_04935 [Dehalococcoidia bacterium]|nr:hypothetical protein [Dehalococcoidia bacterium]